ncbi:MAG: HlyD family efflux transporter periplasmic adaptor subunit [Gammaproteobacteria bacterium]|nr:HlyD family efflux transporter periplasmic adaptor subunit [Gammaproteobacteria bacterium]
MMAQNSNNLFRERAVAHKIMGPPSAPVITLVSHFKLQLYLWVVLLLVATYLLTKTTYKETVAAPGVLEPVQDVQKIVSPVAARVEKIHVSQGERVERGDILASLSTGIYNGQGVSVVQENIQALRIDRELLVKKFDVQQMAQRQSRHWSRLAAVNVQNSKLSLEEEAQLLVARTQLSDQNLQAVSTLLQSGNSSAREFDQQYQVHLELLGRRQALSQRLLQYDYELNSLNNAEQLAKLDSEQASLQVQRELQGIDQEIMRLSNQALFTVVAEGPGIVAAVGLVRGKSVLPNQPLFFINPLKTELQATLYVSAAVQAKLVAGQSVLLRYDAFDFRLYGRHEATVVAIGKARLDPRETTLPIIGINEPVFKVIAELHESTIQGDSLYKLQSGTTFMADFVLWEMSLMQFIFRPILGLQGKVT